MKKLTKTPFVFIFIIFLSLLSCLFLPGNDAFAQARKSKATISASFNRAASRMTKLSGRFNRAARSSRISANFNKRAGRTNSPVRFNSTFKGKRITHKFNRFSKNRGSIKKISSSVKNGRQATRIKNKTAIRIFPKFNRVSKRFTIKNKFNINSAHNGKLRTNFIQSNRFSRSVQEVMGKNYKAVHYRAYPVKNKSVLKTLNHYSNGKGNWVKVFEGGIQNGKKKEIHYFHNPQTKQYYDVKKAYEKWHQKEFK